MECHRNLNYFERVKSSTFRELTAILSSFDMLANTLRVIVQKGSGSFELQQLALRIFEISQRHSHKLIMKWIPRELNCPADLLSKCIDTDAWGIFYELFHALNAEWGAFTVNSFANGRNKNTRRFLLNSLRRVVKA